MMKTTIVSAAFLMAAGAASAQENLQFATQVPSMVRSDPKMNVHTYHFRDNRDKQRRIGDAMVDRAVGIMCETAPRSNMRLLQTKELKGAPLCRALTNDIPDEWKKVSAPDASKSIVKETTHKRGTTTVIEGSVQENKHTKNLSFNFRIWNIATRQVCLHASEGSLGKDGAYKENLARHWGCFTISDKNSYYDTMLARLKLTRSI